MNEDDMCQAGATAVGTDGIASGDALQSVMRAEALEIMAIFRRSLSEDKISKLMASLGRVALSGSQFGVRTAILGLPDAIAQSLVEEQAKRGDEVEPAS